MSDLHQNSFRDDIDKVLLYNNWSKNYDKDVKNKGYVAPKEMTKLLLVHIKKSDTVLDFGCGTGLFGKEIKKKIAPKELYGLDISMGMIDISRKKGIYDKLYCINIENRPTFYIPNLNVIVSCGVFLEGHVSFNMISNIMNLLLKDGKFFFTTRLSFFQKNKKLFQEVVKKYDAIFMTNLKYLDNVDCLAIGLKKI